MIENRRFLIQFIFLVTGFIFLAKLFTIQVTDKTFAKAATDNIVFQEIEYPFRGLIFDRNGKLIVSNDPQFDLEVIPNEVKIEDTTTFSSVLEISKSEIISRLANAKKYSYVRPSPFVKMISNEEFGKIQSHLADFQGFQIQARTVRTYKSPVLSNVLGYTAEISKEELILDSENYYQQGDYIGKSGIEAEYERYLRGKRGIKYKLKNAKGEEKGSFENGDYDTLAVPGLNLVSTIDIEIQNYAEKLLSGKVGSIVAIEPATGEILAMVSGPTYDPGLLAGRKFSSNFLSISEDTLKPFFNRPIMAMYPPGSIFKTIQALIGLQEGVIDPDESIFLDGNLIGDHAPPGYYDLHEAIRISSNNYFHLTFRKILNQGRDANTFIDSRLGLDVWNQYIKKFGLGDTLGIDLPNEKGGNIPTSDYYDRLYGRNSWKFSTIASLSIGQGEMLLSPLQMANIAAVMANRGYFYRPHLVKGIGEANEVLPKYTVRYSTGIDSGHYKIVINAMQEALYGTAPRAIIKDLDICGKTGTAENPHGEDHSVFMAFAPKENPVIAISVYVENSGWGGRAAASTASLIIEKYIKGQISRQWLEDYVLRGEFLD